MAEKIVSELHFFSLIFNQAQHYTSTFYVGLFFFFNSVRPGRNEYKSSLAALPLEG